jgi:hypothetical protein
MADGSEHAAVVKLCGEHDLATSADVDAALAPLFGSVLVDDGVRVHRLDRDRRADAKVARATARRDRLELSYQTGTHVARVMEIIDVHQSITVHVLDPRSTAPSEEARKPDDMATA